MHSISFREEAIKDLDDALSYYSDIESLLSTNLESEFGKNFKLLLNFPKIGKIFDRSVRVINLKKFPYKIYYIFENEEIKIIRVLHDNMYVYFDLL